MKAARRIPLELAFNPTATPGASRALFSHIADRAGQLKPREIDRKPELAMVGEQLKFDETVLRRR